MKICLVSQSYPPETAQGGVGTQTWNKARALVRQGHDVHVLSCAGQPGPDLSTEIADGITVHRMQPPGQERGKEFPVFTTHTYQLGYSWSVLRHLHNMMETVILDVIDFAEYGAEGFSYQLDRTLWNWAPVVVQLHAPLALLAEHIGWPEKDSQLYQVGTFMEGVSIRLADGLMACSSNIAEFAADFYGVPRESIDVVHCGVDAEAFQPDGVRPSGGDAPTILFVGNVAGNKGIETVFEATLKLRSRYPNIRLEVVGASNDDLLGSFQARAQHEGASANVKFYGFVQTAELPDFYRRASVFCSPAQYEGGVANVYLEAMACGCPVIASTAGGAPEAVVDGENGFLVPPDRTDAVIEALTRIFDNPELQKQMGRAARTRVESYFAMDKYILRVLEVYRKAIARAERRSNRLRSETDETDTRDATAANAKAVAEL